MTAARCWLLHHWGKWETYVYPSFSVILNGPLAGRQVRNAETRQRRTCAHCGKLQDRFVRDGG